MALIECPECGGKVSDKAPACMHCGYPIHTHEDHQETYSIFITSCGNKDLYASTLLYCDLGYSQEETDYILKSVPIMIAQNVNGAQTAAIVKLFSDKGINMSVLDEDDNFVDENALIEEYPDDIDVEMLKGNQKNTLSIYSNSSKPKCPTCQSTDIQKISLSDKAIGGALFGLLSSNVRNTMRCNNCGYKW